MNSFFFPSVSRLVLNYFHPVFDTQSEEETRNSDIGGDRQTDRQADRQTDTDRQTNTHSQTEIERERLQIF